jgi:hypothetical protein
MQGNAETKKQNSLLFKDKLDALKNKIPEVKFLETGINISESPSAFDLVLTTHFDTEIDLESYRSHADHQEVVEIIREIGSEVAVVDYSF